MKIKKRWFIDPSKRKDLLHKIALWLDDIIESKAEAVPQLDLTDLHVAPYHVWSLFKNEFGYTDEDIDSNGWQQDFWIVLTQEDYPTVIVGATGMTHEVNLELSINSENELQSVLKLLNDVQDARLQEVTQND